MYGAIIMYRYNLVKAYTTYNTKRVLDYDFTVKNNNGHLSCYCCIQLRQPKRVGTSVYIFNRTDIKTVYKSSLYKCVLVVMGMSQLHQ